MDKYQSFLDEPNDRAQRANSPSPMIMLGNPATMLPTNAITDLATSSMQPVPTTPASPMQYDTMAPLAVVNPNAYRSNLEARASFESRISNDQQPEDLTEIDYQRNDYAPGMQGLGADAAPSGGLSKNMIILGVIGIGLCWYFSQKKKGRA